MLSAKYLRVIIDSELNCNEHVNHICKKSKHHPGPSNHKKLSNESQSICIQEYDLNWSMLRQSGPLTLTVTLTVLKQFSADLPDLQ